MSFQENRGLAFIIVLVFVFILALAAGSFMLISSSEIRMARRQNDSTRAFYLAEAGVERAIYDLNQEFEVGDQSWADGDINGIDVTQGGTVTVPQNRDETKAIDDPAQPFYSLPYSSTSLDGGGGYGGYYSVSLLNISGKTDEIWVKSTGTCGDSTRTIVVFGTETGTTTSTSIWDAAIFGGAGGAGVLINGNVDICGTVRMLGEEPFVDSNGNGVYDAGESWTEIIVDGQWGPSLSSTDYAINMSGSAKIRNNYSTIPTTLSNRIPACPTTTFNGETVDSLGAELRVKRGLVGLGGSATAGQADVPLNTLKETLDGVYVTDGYGGNQGASSVYSDNGTANVYDPGDTVTFPSLSSSYTDPNTGTTYTTYNTYAQANGLVITDAAKLSTLASLTPASSFTYTDGTNTISMDGSGNLTISGIVYLDNSGTLGMDKHKSNTTITYSGSGTIVAEGRVDIDVNLLTANTFPTTDALGIITPGVIEFDAANIDVMGAFYAETRIDAKKQTDVAGTFISNYVNMGQNVPSIFQVPDLSNYLPMGMIDSSIPTTTWSFTMSDWQEM